jgi:hypothetical protein
MKSTKRHSGISTISIAIITLALLAHAIAQDSPTVTTTSHSHAVKKKAVPTAAELEVQQLKELVQAQQQQINQQGQQVDQLRTQLQQVVDATQQANAAAASAQSKADTAAAQASGQDQALVAIHEDISGVKQSSSSTALALQETQKNVAALENPISILYKGITLTPGGFMSADTVWRRTGLASDLATPLNSIPYEGSSSSKLSEFFASGRATRLALLAEGDLKNAKLSGYVESDFLSAGTTSTSNSTNSYTLRLRQGWAQAALNNGWTFTGGQMWTLVAETRNGVDNRSEAIPLTIDTSYNAGFSNPRQFGFRASKDFSNKLWLAFSAENAQTLLTAHGNTQDFVLGAAGTSSGAYNPGSTYSYNKLPDFIGKAVFQPGPVHLEVFGLVSTFRDRLFPDANLTTPSAKGAYNDTSIGKGIGANARVSLANKHLDLAAHFLGGSGTGRYGTSQLADVTVRPDGVLVPIRNYQTLGTVEYRGRKLDLYAYAGGEYDERTAFLSGGKGEGYGSPLFSNAGCSTEIVPGTPVAGQYPTSTSGFLPGTLTNCTGDTRSIIEGTFGFWYRFYKGPRGTIQWGPQLSYVDRNSWSGAGRTPNAVEPMVFTSFRYYLP